MFFETRNLCFAYYKSAMTLKDVSFSVEKNSKTLILASKDMGKSTFLKVLSGFEDSRFGYIYLNGHELKQVGDKEKNFSLILSKPVLLNGKSIRENLDFQCEVCEKEKLSDEKIKELLKEFRIERDLNTKVKKMSLFEKRKLQIVRAMLKEPQIMFLDDQFEGLGDAEIEEMFEIIQKLFNANNLTLFFAIGDETFKRFESKILEFMCDKVLYLNLAKVTEFKTINEFKNSYLTLDILKFLENSQTESCYIEKDKDNFWLCKSEQRMFMFDRKFNKKLEELKLEFGDIEECEVFVLNGLTLDSVDSSEFNKKLKEKSIFIYSNLTENLII